MSSQEQARTATEESTTNDLQERFGNVSTRQLGFDNEDSESYVRMQLNGTVIRRKGYFLYLVALTDRTSQAEPHVVQLLLDGHLFGRCDCDGFRFHEQESAHLWSLTAADRLGVIHVHDTKAPLGASEVCPTCGETPEEVAGHV